MKKIVLYCVAAAILGIALIVGPLFALAMLEFTDEYLVHLHLREWTLQKPNSETYGSNMYSYSSLDVEVFALCFLIALTVYLLFKRMV
ncbi:MAG: hypothetical protein ACPL0C_04870 [Candidatus Bathyarchaeales archaeon]